MSESSDFDNHDNVLRVLVKRVEPALRLEPEITPALVHEIIATITDLIRRELERRKL